MSNEKNYMEIIDQIELIRTRNNKNWMDILRLAFKYSPDEAAVVLAEIYREDKAISNLAEQLTN